MAKPPQRRSAGEPSAAADSPALAAGRVGRAHGLDGSFYVLRPRPVLLELGTQVHLGGQSRRITRRAGTDERPIVGVEGCVSREQATGLRGEDLLVAVLDAPQLGPGEFWPEQLEGSCVHDGQTFVGVVRRMLGLPSCEALEVQRADGSELLVPLVSDAIRAVDVDEGRIEVDLGFLEGAR